MDIDSIRQSGLLLDCVSGSRAYGLATKDSDTDLKGVFVLPKAAFYGFNYTEQVNNATNDEVYYELGRFFELLTKNNPNILELLATPEDCIRFRHPIIEKIRPEMFLSRLCNQTFAGYAISQIKKAKGLNKKIVNPVEEERKSVLDFCYILLGQGSVLLKDWLTKEGFEQQDLGAVRINHMREVYVLFHKKQLSTGKVKGILSGPEANDISVSSVDKGLQPLAVMSFNKDGYSSYCKDYKAYWDWVANRNEIRYQHTLNQDKNYDAKNMMHTFRLLHMAEEIALEESINVYRSDREYLLGIRNGNYSYEELYDKAHELLERINEHFQESNLPETPDAEKAEALLVELRDQLYR